MIEVEEIEVNGFDHAIRGMRNPMNSWNRSDSRKCLFGQDCDYCRWNYFLCSQYFIGPNDLKLMQRLYKAGTEHRKYLRMIHVSMDITAPLYWWKEFDTYKVGPTADSCSTMHKIAAEKFELSNFSYEHLTDGARYNLEKTIDELNLQRELWNKYGEKCYWWGMIQLLPESYNQKRTVDMNYENVFTIIHQRTDHKLDEWNEFVNILKALPYVSEIGEFDEQSTTESCEKA